MSLKTLRLPNLVLAGLAAAALAGPAMAGKLDRDNSTPTAWRWYYNTSSTTIVNSQNQGYRVVAVNVHSTSPLRFDVAMVRNSGSYARNSRGFWYGTPGFVESKRAGRRVTALTPYVVNNTLRLAACFVANTGSNQKTWGYWYGTWSHVWSKATGFGGRIVDLDSYVIGNTRYFTVVAVKNSGSDYKPWWTYLSATPAFIAGKLSTNKARLLDLNYVGNGRYNAVMVRDSVKPLWGWYYGITASQISDLVGQAGGRLIHIERQGSRYNIVLINNSNALTTKVGNILRKIPTGFTGAYLKQVNGSTLASLQSSRQYEPASSLKTLHHVTAMRHVALNKIGLGSNIKSYIGGPKVCPKTSFPWKWEQLQVCLSAMMKSSDNTRTLSVEKHFGRTTMMAVAGALGMSKTQYNHSIGCGTPANKFTLVDAGKLFSAVANGYLGPQKNNFYNLMSNSTLSGTIDSEAGKLGLPAAVVAAFKSYVLHASKGGSYGVSGISHRSLVGWFRLPFCINNKVQMREFVYGNYCNDVKDYGDNKAAYDKILLDAREEMRREMVRQALVTWKNGKVDGKTTVFGRGCRGSNGTVSHYATGTPEIGKVQYFRLSNGPKSSVAIMHIGFSKTKWGAIPLPLSLTALGATGCYLYTDPTLPFGIVTSSTGSGIKTFLHANAKGLVGFRFFTQFMCIDPQGNNLGLTFSNGLETLIGGWPK